MTLVGAREREKEVWETEMTCRGVRDGPGNHAKHEYDSSLGDDLDRVSLLFLM